MKNTAHTHIRGRGGRSGPATLVGRAAMTMAVGMLLAAGCGGGNEESQTTTTSATLLPSTTATTAAPTTTSIAVPPAGESPVIHLAGYTTVYSQDGHLRVSGWLDRPAEVSVGRTPVEVRDGQYEGISTFETVLDLEPGSHRIPVTATGSRDLENEIVLSVLVEPALEMQLAMIQESIWWGERW